MPIKENKNYDLEEGSTQLNLTFFQEKMFIKIRNRGDFLELI